MKILFIAWDGPQVNYLQSLFLPIFAALRPFGYEFSVLQFTWGETHADIEALCAEVGVRYHRAQVLRRPVSAGGLLTALTGSYAIRSIARKNKVDALMPRSTLPALAALIANRKLRLPLIFDADGLPLDERVDFAGRSGSAISHRFLRDIESETVRNAQAVITRTKQATDILNSRAGAGTESDKFFAVVNGRDERVFVPGSDASRSQVRRELGVADSAPLLVYIGSIGPQYCFEKMLDLFEQVRARDSSSCLLIITGNVQIAESLICLSSTSRENSFVVKLAPENVPKHLAASDLGIAFRQRSFSMQAVAPIKIGEYLLCGVPVLATADVGDVSSLEQSKAGRLVNEMDADEIVAAAKWFVDAVIPSRDLYRESARDLGVAEFSLARSVEMYRAALQKGIR